jgi:hypothetical protein
MGTGFPKKIMLRKTNPYDFSARSMNRATAIVLASSP